MGSYAYAHIAFGWIMPSSACAWEPEHEDCKRVVDDFWDEDDDFWDCKHEDGEDADEFSTHGLDLEYLDAGYDGSSYGGECSTIIYLKDSERYTSWVAMDLGSMEFTSLPLRSDGSSLSEFYMRQEAERISIRLPSEPASWILWPSYG